jgi:hypothetical protein
MTTAEMTKMKYRGRCARLRRRWSATTVFAWARDRRAGGSFKVTEGSCAIRPNRVIDTPLSEAGFVGLKWARPLPVSAGGRVCS